MSLFKEKYRIESTRLPGWDYSWPGCYFVTICTHQRQSFFGQVVGGDVALSPMGEIVADEWVKTGVVRANVALDAWVVMPNHVHGIIVITHQINDDANATVETPRRGVSTPSSSSSPSSNRGGANPQWKSNTLGAIIGQIKSQCTKRIWGAGHTHFQWQPRFYDRILCDANALDKARQYIINNPIRWAHDRNRPPDVYM